MINFKIISLLMLVIIGFLCVSRVLPQKSMDGEIRFEMVENGLEVKEGRAVLQSVDFLKLKIKGSLTNFAKTPLILFYRVPTCNQIEVALNAKDFSTSPGNVTRYYVQSSSVLLEPTEWNAFKSKIDKRRPPKIYTTTLSPLESLATELTIEISIPKAPLNAYDEYVRSQKSLSQLKQLSPFYIRLSDCQLTGSLLSMDSNLRLSSLEKLKQRWSSLGQLYIEPFSSDPILFNLK